MKNIHIGKSTIAGKGIIAGEDIRKGEFIVALSGRLVQRTYRKKSDYRNEQTFIPVAQHWWIDPGYPFRYLNHSCDPNAGFKTPHRFYAMRDIKKGEELTADYSTIEYVDFWEMKCHCGAQNCRKIVRSVQFLPKRKYKQYLPYIPRFLQNLYLQGHRRATI